MFTFTKKAKRNKIVARLLYEDHIDVHEAAILLSQGDVINVEIKEASSGAQIAMGDITVLPENAEYHGTQ